MVKSQGSISPVHGLFCGEAGVGGLDPTLLAAIVVSFINPCR